MDKQGLSVIMITQDAARCLSASLDSVTWADEIIIVDSGSQDETLAIAARYTDKIFQKPWQGFGPQKQFALSKATQPWVLSLDADEILSLALQGTIQGVLQKSLANQPIAYKIPFQSYFCGHAIRFGDWRNEHHVRLFQRDLGCFSDEVVHEKIYLKGKIKCLPKTACIHHHSYPDWETVLSKMQRYSSIGADKKWAQGVNSSVSKAISHSLWTFLRGYLFKGGFLDGTPGFLLALSRAEETRYRYLKLYRKQA